MFLGLKDVYKWVSSVTARTAIKQRTGRYKEVGRAVKKVRGLPRQVAPQPAHTQAER